MKNLKSRNFRRDRLKNKIRSALKKILQMGILVVVGEYMLINVINASLSSVYNQGQGPVINYRDMPRQIVNFAVGEKPILHVANTYDSLTKKMDFNFDDITQKQYPVHVRGSRPDFRALDLQDKEGAKVGYVVKF